MVFRTLYQNAYSAAISKILLAKEKMQMSSYADAALIKMHKKSVCIKPHLLKNKLKMEEELIELFRNNPCLYDKRHKNFSRGKKRNEKLEELSRKFNVPVRKLKDRWRTLRDTYQKEKKRLATVDDPNSVRKWKWMDHLAFLDETQEYSEEILSETTQDHYDDSYTDYDKTNSSWNEHFNNNDNYDDNDQNGNDYDNEHLETKEEIIKIKPMSNSLLMPINQKQKLLQQNIKTEEYAVEERSFSNLEKAIMMDINQMNEESALKNDDALWEPSPSKLCKKSSIKLFCDSLAVQIEEANLTPFQISALQIEFLKKLQEFLPKDK